MGPDLDIEAVTRDSAARWLMGEFSVGDRLRACPDLDFSRREVIFLNILGDRQSYRAGVARTLDLIAAGCTSAVAHACGAVMLDRYRRQGAIPIITETINWRGRRLEARRLFIPPAALAAWAEKMRFNPAGTPAPITLAAP